MKKHRKQSVNVYGQKRLVDVPDDEKLYKIDNREEYQRRRSKSKHITLDDIITELTADVSEDYEESQLLECLHDAMQTLEEDEHRLIKYIFHDGLTEQQTGDILGKSQQAVTAQKQKIIQKLRNCLTDWL